MVLVVAEVVVAMLLLRLGVPVETQLHRRQLLGLVRAEVVGEDALVMRLPILVTVV
jgi:hypothetical protein